MLRDKKPKKDNQHRWLLTYADLITLLMIFFVVLYAISSINARKFQAIAFSLSGTMGSGMSVLSEAGMSMVFSASSSSLDGYEIDAMTQELIELERIKDELENYIEQNGLGAKVSVNMEERGVVVSFQEVALFPLGSAALTPEAKETIDKVGLIIMEAPQYIRVEGHTDSLPISTAQFPSNWELSVARAVSVVQELIHALDFPPTVYLLSVMGNFALVWQMTRKPIASKTGEWIL
ncbi:MAG: flagellar motor protein MotB [Candidatus Syntrophopropionicum ammoniitolerans]